MKQKLLLWDIDGTLITTQRAGKRALTRTIKTAFGIESNLEFLDMAGRTDPFILREIARELDLNLSPQATRDFYEVYFGFLEEELKKVRGRTHEGILKILAHAAQRADLAQGLLTGNLERGAKIKLVHYEIWHYFEFGAYGDDSAARNELGPFALSRASKRHGVTFRPGNVFVIGDTPHDVACGKAIGAKTIAVATGGHTVEELAACGPTAVLRDFHDPEAFFRIVDGK